MKIEKNNSGALEIYLHGRKIATTYLEADTYEFDFDKMVELYNKHCLTCCDCHHYLNDDTMNCQGTENKCHEFRPIL